MDPVSAIGLVIINLVNSAPKWLPPIREVFLDKAKEQGVDFILDKGKQGLRDTFRLGEKEQIRRLQLAINNAVERGLAQLDTPQERDLYRSMLEILSEEGPRNEVLRREAFRLFTFSDTPNFATLAETYHLSQRISAMAKDTTYTEIDIAPYLSIFFNALTAELYADPFFRQQMSDVLRMHADLTMQRDLKEIIETLHQIYGTLESGYTIPQFEKDTQTYTEHIAITLRHLKLPGMALKEDGNENRDPEIESFFVPLLVALAEQSTSSKQTKEQNASNKELKDSIVDLLEQTSCLILLGRPGFGKSTVIRHLAWSHAMANLSNPTSLTNSSLPSRKPLPLRIELRRLAEDRRQHPNYNFLTYTSEVLLGRAGLNIPTQMFEMLLTRRKMIVLFDGLDEVASLDDRSRLVEEIENFAQHYPGNRFLVTSRPVGYKYVSFSAPLFSQAEIKPFNDEQIYQFLEHWYAFVSGHSKLPLDEQNELKDLYETLKYDQRLYSLAETPLMLTVIADMYRRKRLPHTKSLLYKECADYLLERWAMLKGTSTRWQNLKLSKKDQHACVAHLGFVLHARSQKEQEDNTATGKKLSNNDRATDVPSRFLLQEVERFLETQKLFPSKAEERLQAERLLESVQVEAGLIEEHGKDERGEPLYGFVHRTFQEYFAATDVYGYFLQEGKLAIISEFLKEHLYDSHWYEVILLLFEMLVRKPATAMLGQILEGKISNQRGLHDDITRQNLFFTSLCLSKEISVENDLTVSVIAQLIELVKSSPFPSQRFQALEELGALMQTLQYEDSASKALMRVMAEATEDTLIKLRAAQVAYEYSPKQSDDEHQAILVLSSLVKQSSFSVKQTLQIARVLYNSCPPESEQEQQVIQTLLELTQRSDLSFEELVDITQHLYQFCPSESIEQQKAKQILSDWVERSDLSFEHILQVALIYFLSSQDKLSELDEVTELLLMRHYRSLFDYVASILQLVPIGHLEGWVSQIFLDLAQRPDLSLEPALLIIQTHLMRSIPAPAREQQLSTILLSLAQ